MQFLSEQDGLKIQILLSQKGHPFLVGVDFISINMV